jgi:hypothetical protein
VTKGHRLCLVYNLIWGGYGPAPALISDNESTIAKAIEGIREWEVDPEGPSKLVYVLDGVFTIMRVRGRQTEARRMSCMTA